MTDEAPGERADRRTEIRRRDRGKDDEWIRHFLRRAPWGVLAMVGEGGQPFVNSNLFVFDEEAHCLYLHTARTGRTRDLLTDPGPVAFTVAAMGRLLPADEALEFSVEYAGVVVFGEATVVEDEDERIRGLQAILDKYAPHLRPGRDYREISEGELKRTVVYRVDIEAWSGKEKVAERDFPGAYELPTMGIPVDGAAGGPPGEAPS